MGKKEIFHKPTAKEIMRGRTEKHVERGILEALLEHHPATEYVSININGVAGQLIPDEFFHPADGNPRIHSSRTEASRKFMRHANEIRFPRYTNINDAITELTQIDQAAHKTHHTERYDPYTRPIWVRLYEHAKNDYACGVSIMPAFAQSTKRKIALIECVDGLMLFQYAALFSPIIVDNERQNAHRIAQNGAVASAYIPSRTPKQARYKIKLEGIPLANNPRKLAIATTILPKHEGCTDTDMRDERYTLADGKENPFIPNWDAHSYAAYLAITRAYQTEGNRVPWKTFILPIPSPLMCRIADTLKYDTLIYTRESPEDKKPQYRPLNNAEREILLQQFMHQPDKRHEHRIGPDQLLWMLHRDPKLTEPYFRTLRDAMQQRQTTV